MEKLYERYRALLFTLAYQLTGSPQDAEDAVQDVFVKAYGVRPERLEEPKAYLCRMVTNHCLNQLKSARKRREVYVGPWLPEPIRTPEADTLETKVVRRDLLSYAMLVLLERLTPTERAVFVLREALGFEYLEIGQLLGKQETNCRKLMSRARSKMGIAEEAPIAAETVRMEWIARFLAFLEQGNVDQVMSMLTDDVTFVADGGGKALAFKQPVTARDQVARVLLDGFTSIASGFQGSIRFEYESLNGEISIVFRVGEAALAALFMQLRGGKLASMYAVRNPDKLARI